MIEVCIREIDHQNILCLVFCDGVLIASTRDGALAFLLWQAAEQINIEDFQPTFH